MAESFLKLMMDMKPQIYEDPGISYGKCRKSKIKRKS
jgi:hypothetical protein